MIFPEHLLRIRLQRSIDAINRDPARKLLKDIFGVDESFKNQKTSELYKSFYKEDSGIPELEGMVDQAIRWWEKEPPKVHLCLNWAMIDQPGIHIDYGSENSEGFIGQNMSVEDSDEHGGIIHRIGDEYTIPSTVLWIMTSNKEWTVSLYYIVRSLLHLDWLWYAWHGLRNMQISGGNVDRMMMMMPNVGYVRQITLSYQYSCNVQRVLPAPMGGKFTVEGAGIRHGSNNR